MDYNREDQVWGTVCTISQCSACYYCIWWRTEVVFFSYINISGLKFTFPFLSAISQRVEDFFKSASEAKVMINHRTRDPSAGLPTSPGWELLVQFLVPLFVCLSYLPHTSSFNFNRRLRGCLHEGRKILAPGRTKIILAPYVSCVQFKCKSCTVRSARIFLAER